MAVLTSTSPARRHVLGDLAVRHYALSGNNGDTFTPPAQQNIDHVNISPTTDISVGYTLSNNTITFASAGAWAADVQIFSRVG